ncbi:MULTISPECIES: hypothetical protein [unclassified Bradyrhizobium]|uniref:hypothetical protein n=1 Tax=unclassified Bradyrhizobium TaxID=2631580 RepID=UPI001FF74391|nr:MULTISPECIES: hypothetical protein [unclassified Bradyrhizobium]MCK1533162.1 hypothetical protein [Bradyrhizobium sp. 176]MCK1558266.1 hypothetical protein [Bradyrhizobium sp. 171]
MALARPMFPPAAGLAHASVSSGLVPQGRRRQTALRRLARLREEASAEIERLIAFMDASDAYVTTELEDQVDDHPCDTDELDRDENDDEPSLGALEGHDNQAGIAWDATWQGHGTHDRELDPAEAGVGDLDALLEQVGTQDWQQGAMA